MKILSQLTCPPCDVSWSPSLRMFLPHDVAYEDHGRQGRCYGAESHLVSVIVDEQAYSMYMYMHVHARIHVHV